MAKLRSLVEVFKEKEQENLHQLEAAGVQTRKPGRPKGSTSAKEKARLNFLVDQDFADDMKALAMIRKKNLTSLLIETMEKEIEASRRDIDILKSMQK